MIWVTSESTSIPAERERSFGIATRLRGFTDDADFDDIEVVNRFEESIRCKVFCVACLSMIADWDFDKSFGMDLVKETGLPLLTDDKTSPFNGIDSCNLFCIL